MAEINEERRSYLRGDFSYKVKFRIMGPDECGCERMVENPLSLRGEKILKAASVCADGFEKEAPVSGAIVDFLLRMDDKLDQILAALSQNDQQDQLFRECLGVDISASGMGIITDRVVAVGQRIHAVVVLSRLPFVSMEVIGEIVQITPGEDRFSGKLHAGIRFLDLEADDMEKIIKCVFQNERAAIREMKRQAEEDPQAGDTDD